MSEDRIFNTRHKPRRNSARGGYELTHQNTIRVFRASPEDDVTLQVRLVKDYITVGLSFTEARDIASALLEQAGVSCPSQ